MPTVKNGSFALIRFECLNDRKEWTRKFFRIQILTALEKAADLGLQKIVWKLPRPCKNALILNVDLRTMGINPLFCNGSLNSLYFRSVAPSYCIY